MKTFNSHSTPANNDAGLISETEVLETLIPVSSRTLRNYREKGLIPYIKVAGGRRVLYHRKSLIEAMLRMQQGGTP